MNSVIPPPLPPLPPVKANRLLPAAAVGIHTIINTGPRFELAKYGITVIGVATAGDEERDAERGMRNVRNGDAASFFRN